jgi:hypothetical protein
MNHTQKLEKDLEKVETLLLNTKRRIEEMQLHMHKVDAISAADVKKWLKYIEDPGFLQAEYGINVSTIADIPQ